MSDSGQPKSGSGNDSSPSQQKPDTGSILKVIEAISGVKSRVMLRDVPGEPTPIISPTSKKVGTSLLGTTRYHLVGEVARGGVGVIMKSRDEDLGRDVAMKILLEDHADKEEIVQRFIEEAQIGGQLQHPGIVPVYEIGLLADKRPYFTMKLVKGHTLSALLQNRSDPAEGRQHYIAAFEKACQTMAYAHARGVVHRDLKPSNIMVGAFGEVQIVDWGFAKVLGQGGVEDEKRAKEQISYLSIIETIRSSGGEGSQSVAGSVMGTPAYMPPEQALGSVDKMDERSDVFCLGGILCETLTGLPPYTGDGEDRIMKAVQANLKEAFQRLDKCGADRPLIDLTKKLLSPGRNNRPANAGVVAQQVSEYRASVEERVRKSQLAEVEAKAQAETARLKALEQKRHAEEEKRRRVLTMALAAAVLLCVLIVGGGYLWAAGESQARLAETTRRVNAALEEAAKLGGLAKAAAVGELGPWERALEAANLAKDRASGEEIDPDLLGRVDATLKEFINGRDAARHLAAKRKREIAIQGRLAEIRDRSGDPLEGPKADAEYAQAFQDYGVDLLKLNEAAAAERLRESAIRVELAAALDDWAWVRARGGDRAFSLKLRKIAQNSDPDAQRMALRDAITRADKGSLQTFAKTSNLTKLSAPTARLLANALAYAGDRKEAVAVLRTGRKEHPGDVWLNFDLAYWLTTMEEPRWLEAVRYYTVALALHPKSAGIRNNLGSALIEIGEHKRAVDNLREAIDLRPGYARAQLNLGLALRRGEMGEGIVELKKAVDLNPGYALAYHHLGVAYRKKKEHEEAIKNYREACRLDPELDVAHFDLVEALIENEQVDEAVAFCLEVLKKQESAAWAHHNLGFALVYKKNYPAALACFRRAKQIDPGYARVYQDLGAALWHMGDLQGAIDAYTQAIALEPEEASAYYNRAVMYESKGDLNRAIAEYREAIRLKPDYSNALDDLGAVYWNKGETQTALGFYKRAVKADPTSGTASSRLGAALAVSVDRKAALAEYLSIVGGAKKPNVTAFYQGLANRLRGRGKYDEAVACIREAVRLEPEDRVLQRDLGIALGWQGGKAEALAAYRQWVKEPSDKNKAAFVNGLGDALYNRSDLDESLACYEEAIALQRQNATYHLNRANTYYYRSEWDHAIEAYLSTIQRDPYNLNAYIGLGRVLGRTKGYDEAVAFLRTRFGGGGRYFEAAVLNGIGAGLAAQGDLTGAVMAYGEALERHQTAAATQSNLYDAYRRQGEFEDAVEAIRAAIRLQPGNAESHRRLGYILGGRHSPASAKRQYGSLTGLDLVYSEGRFHVGLAQALRDRGLLEDAKSICAEAVRLDRENAGAYNNLGSICERMGGFEEAAKAYRKSTDLLPIGVYGHHYLCRVLTYLGRL
ncbi:MAG: tetratricopeptide repeat protein, partial [Planctomycetota bacterium]